MNIFRKGFSLVELMVTVSILSVGIVGILRSFLTSASSLDSMSNRIKAYQILDTKMNEFEQKSIEEKGLSKGDIEEKITLLLRPAQVKAQITPLEIEGSDEVLLNEVKITLGWNESGKYRDATLSNYLPKKR